MSFVICDYLRSKFCVTFFGLKYRNFSFVFLCAWNVLNIFADPPVVDTLYRQDIIEGRNLSVTCKATPGNPDSTIFYWNKIDDSRFIQNGNIIYIPNIQRDGSGTYICIAENSYINGGNGTHNQTMVINVQCKLIK